MWNRPPLLTCVLYLAAALLPCMAQSITAGLVGTVRDPSGAVIPAATITATNVATNSRGTTHADSNGNYVLLGLEPGSYMVEISAAGFKKYVRSGVALELQQKAELDVSLEVGAASDTVTVRRMPRRSKPSHRASASW